VDHAGSARGISGWWALNDRLYHRIQTVSNDTVTDRGPSTPRGRATTCRPLRGFSRVHGVTLARSLCLSDAAPCRGAGRNVRRYPRCVAVKLDVCDAEGGRGERLAARGPREKAKAGEMIKYSQV
jgi:hypothetical protein